LLEKAAIRVVAAELRVMLGAPKSRVIGIVRKVFYRLGSLGRAFVPRSSRAAVAAWTHERVTRLALKLKKEA
jgi:hypothetical protein